MKSLLVIVIFFAFTACRQVQAEQLQSRLGHLYWAVGPNFGLLGNIRLGFGSFEVGVLQGTGFGTAWITRTSSPIFFEIGALTTTGGAGIIGGGGLEWNTSSFFRWRTDITVSADSGYQTQSFVAFGGVLIL